MDFEILKNTAVEDISKVPEHLRPLYVEKDGKHTLNDGMKSVAETIDGLARSNREATKIKGNANKEAQEARQALAGFKTQLKEIGLDAEDTEKFTAEFKKIQEAITKGDAGKVNWDKMRADLEKAHKAALEAKDGEITGMSKTLQKYLVDSEAVRAISDAKGAPTLLLPHVRAHTKVIKDGEDYVVRVVDAAGDPRGDHKGGFMTVADLVKEMRASAEFGRAFDAEEKGGTGKPPVNGAVRMGTDASKLSPTQKIQLGLQKQQAGRR